MRITQDLKNDNFVLFSQERLYSSKEINHQILDRSDNISLRYFNLSR